MTDRNSNLIRELKLSFIYKIASVGLSFLIVRCFLQYLGIELYGVWAVILSVLQWIVFFDLGLGNGVKNKIAECLARNDMEKSRQYISTGYIVIFFLAAFLYCLFISVSLFINWQKLFNTTILSNSDFNKLVNIVVFFILLNFVLSISLSVFNAFKQSSLLVKQQLLSQLFSFIFLIILISFSEQEIIFVAYSYGIALVLSNLVISFFFYYQNKPLIPKVSFYDKNKAKALFNLGFKFFYLQLTAMLMMTTDGIITAQLLGVQYVSGYDVMYKYFGIILLVHSLINTPLWPMYTDAYIKNDYVWISNTLKKMFLLLLLYLFVGSILYLAKDFLISLWLGKNNLLLINSNYVYCCAMVIMIAWHTIVAFFTNGINKTNNQAIATTVGTILNVPLSIYFVEYLGMGLNGVMLATIVSLSIFVITGTWQAYTEVKRMKLKVSL